MAMTGGDDWVKLIEVLGEYSLVNSVIFYFYITFATMVMLNLVTGMFVEGAQRIIQEDKDKDAIHKAARAFVSMDVDANGLLSYEEFTNKLESTGMCSYCEAIGISVEEAHELFMLLDKNEVQELSIAEFVEGCIRLRGPARALDLASLSLATRELMRDMSVLLSTLGCKRGSQRYTTLSASALPNPHEKAVHRPTLLGHIPHLR
eukprot:TRINITY_DN10910_c0_g5_i1.p1 TRINITY_DN10910_c0_g5~~TRINITY_DN10910_c0_g5_i1.p1  ORF type:complete len:239 (+),score=49.44 TRINITY_DN10910_c0_g5_i1:103-717(+)